MHATWQLVDLSWDPLLGLFVGPRWSRTRTLNLYVMIGEHPLDLTDIVVLGDDLD